MSEPDVPLVDLSRQTAELQPQLEAAMRRVLGSGAFILGPEVEAFERELAAVVGVANAVGVASGTDALCLALRAAGVQPGDAVRAREPGCSQTQLKRERANS